MSHSLQWRLSAWLIAAIALTGLVAGMATFSWVYREANRVQDDLLRQAATLAAGSQISVPGGPLHLPGSERDNDLVVLRLGTPDVAHSSLPGPLPDGFSTVNWERRQWRIYVSRTVQQARIVIAQQTEVRHEFASHSGILAVLPLFGLIPALIVLVRWVTQRALQPVADLAQRIDADPMANARELPATSAPAEVQPFLRSINRLLSGLNEALVQCA